MDNIHANGKDSFEHNSSAPSEIDDGNIHSQREMELEDMLNSLKEKFSSLPMNDPLRICILTIAPGAWSVNKIAKEFNCSRRLATKSKDLKASGGVLAESTLKVGRPLSEETEKNVKNFYYDDGISRIMPGKKTFFPLKRMKVAV